MLHRKHLSFIVILFLLSVMPTLAQDSDDVPPFEVVTFTVDRTEVRTGESFTITWEVSGVDNVCVGYFSRWPGGMGQSLCTENTYEGDPDPFFQPAKGSVTVTVEDDNVNYYDVALSRVDTHYFGFEAVPAHVRVEVERVCDHDYLPELTPYVDYMAENDWTFPCPDTAVETVSAAYQPFENGYMLWFEDTIYAVEIFNYPSVSPREDDWDGQPLEIPVTAPEGLLIPERGFGKAWFDRYESIGWDDPVFATGPEIGYEAQIQRLPGGFFMKAYYSPIEAINFIITLPDGRVALFNNNPSSPTPLYDYQVVIPVPRPEPIAICEGAPPSRIAVTTTARVTVSAPGETPQGLRVRATPGGDLLDMMDEGVVFTVVGEARCLDELVWWEIETLDGSLRGWSAEGIAPDDYFMEPWEVDQSDG